MSVVRNLFAVNYKLNWYEVWTLKYFIWKLKWEMLLRIAIRTLYDSGAWI